MLTKTILKLQWKIIFVFSLFFCHQAIANSSSFAWRLLSTSLSSNPAARDGASTAFDPSSGYVILFGGRGDNGEVFNDVWAFDASNNTWIELKTVSGSSQPIARAGASAAFDPLNGQLIIFGGAAAAPLNDTWAFNTHTKLWTQLSDSSNPSNLVPSVRSGASMTFDPCSGQLILFGGNDGATSLNDTWAFDSQNNTWTLLIEGESTNAPAARFAASMDFDASTGLLVLFGGITDNDVFGDTWTLDTKQKQWSNLNLVGPEKRAFALMSFNPCSGQLILFGGADGNGKGVVVYGDTWAFDGKGQTWKKIDLVTPTPEARAAAAGAFDPCVGQFVLFGGSDTNLSCFADTWIFGPLPGTPLAWKELQPTGTPPTARYDAAMDFNPCTGQLILFGGTTDGVEPLGDTWAYDAQGQTWTNLNLDLQNSPPARKSASMAFNPSNGQMILFGGFGSTDALNDTWAFDAKNQTWQELSLNNSPHLANACMAFDPSSGQLVLFGGTSDGTNALNDTWILDLQQNQWTKLDFNKTLIPPPRFGACMAFDPCSGQVILFGGASSETKAWNDTWAFDGKSQAWLELKPSGNLPEAQADAAMAFDPCSGQLVLFSLTLDTQELAGVTWVFDAKANQWTRLPVFNRLANLRPPKRFSASMAFDASSGQMILFGGKSISPDSSALFDTWGLELSTPPQITSNASTTFNVGSPSNFKITTTGFPLPIVTLKNGSLPSGIRLLNLGSPNLIGTPQPGTGGIYDFSLVASNGAEPDAAQNFRLTVHENPSITSSVETFFKKGTFSSFTFTTMGFPHPSITLTGPLPDGLVFVDNKDGTATLSGTPAVGTPGVYSVSLSATNGIEPIAIQSFKLTILDGIYPPRHLKGSRKANRFAAQTDYVNVLTWEAPLQGASPVAYRIYRDRKLRYQVANISRGACLKFKDHNRKKDRFYNYYVVAVDAFGNLSQPAVVKIQAED